MDLTRQAPLLVTERLDLWLPAKYDIAAMHAIVSDAETGRYLGAAGGMADQFQRFSRGAGSWLLYGYGGFTLRLRGDSAVIGNCGVFHSWRGLGEDVDDRPEAGWIVRRDQMGRGFASEAMQAVLDWFDREHGPHRIVCAIEHGNERSYRLAERLGFRPLRDAQWPDGATVKLFLRPPGVAAAPL